MQAHHLLAATALLATSATAQYQAANRTARRVGLEVHEFEVSSTFVQPTNTFRIDGPPGFPFALFADGVTPDTTFGFPIGGNPTPLLLSALNLTSPSLLQIDLLMTPFVGGFIPASGTFTQSFPGPVNLPIGTRGMFQAVIADPLSTTGLTTSNGVLKTFVGQLARPDSTPYAASMPAQAAGSINDVEQGDIDGDGDLDTLLMDCFGTITVFQNIGGQLQRVQVITVPNGTSMELADFDNDSLLDLAVSVESTIGAQVHLNGGLQGPGIVMGAWRQFRGPMSLSFDDSLPGPFGTELETADFNQDGFIDIVLACSNCETGLPNRILRNDANGPGAAPSFTDVTVATLPTPSDDTEDVECTDFDNDGDYDIVVGNFDGPNHARGVEFFYINQGNLQGGVVGTFAGPFTFVNARDDETLDVCCGDVDGDGFPDVYIGNWLENPGSCTPFVRPIQDRLILSAGQPFSMNWRGVDASALLPQRPGSTADVEMTDYDLDGDLDIFVGEGGKCFHIPGLVTTGVLLLDNQGGGYGLAHNRFRLDPRNVMPLAAAGLDVGDMEFGDWQTLWWERDLGVGHSGGFTVLIK